MGAKRPLREEDFPQLSFKQPKQVDYNHGLTFTTEDFISPTTAFGIDFPGEANSNLCESHFDGGLESGDTHGALTADKELETSGPLSFVTSSSSEEDATNQDTSFFSYFPRFFDFGVPFRPPEQFEDPYVILLNSSPRKEVPVGPDHQAKIPQWDPKAREKYLSGSSNFCNDEREQALMGTCIIPMPDLSDLNTDVIGVGRGRRDCSCPDLGSMSCVQQHVKEAREKLQDAIGDKNFAELGFYDMGEVVASKWSTDEEQMFHRVVYSNPASRGRNFWKILSAVFPTRTKKEIVSYYFNVFVLRRRAVQNRSYVLEIDSDDDEEQERADMDYFDGDGDKSGIHLDFRVVGGAEKDSSVESFGDKDSDAGCVEESGYENENVCGDEGSDNNNHEARDGDVCENGDALEMDDGRVK